MREEVLVAEEARVGVSEKVKEKLVERHVGILRGAVRVPCAVMHSAADADGAKSARSA